MGLGGSSPVTEPDGTVLTGVPQTFLLPDGNDQTTQRPDIVPGVPLYVPGGGRQIGPGGVRAAYINAAAFQPPPIDSNGNFTRFGNAPNGIGRALNIWQVDLVLTKETKLTERVAMEFAVEAFNIFNHTQFGDPGNLTLDYTTDPNVPGAVSTLTPASSFGIITSNVNGNGTNTGTGLPRQLQFMLRFKF
jgi:hypothetical protein